MIRLWKNFHEKGPKETNTEKRLRGKYNEFVKVLSENEHALDLMTTLEDKLFNQQLISFPYLTSKIRSLSHSVSNVVESLIDLSGGQYTDLRTRYGEISGKIREIVTGRKELVYTPNIIPMDHIKQAYIDKVGGKVANLGELRNCCDLLTPDGFAATACAFTHFSEFNSLPEKIESVLWHFDATDSRQLVAAEDALKRLFLESRVPPEIADAIRKETEKVTQGHKEPLYWAVRSSAIGEDMQNSFAGQFSTILNVRSDQLLDTYKEVLASKYNARAIEYQRMKNIRDDDVDMSVGFMVMIDPICSGVLYTIDPVRPADGQIVINAVWGLGELLVDGAVSAGIYIVDRKPGFALKKRKLAEQKVFLTHGKDGGLLQKPLPERQSQQPCLNDGQLTQLAQMALQVEAHFKSPQDIEWCFDRHNRLYVLQSRPLNVFEKVENRGTAASINAPVIARAGQPVSPGAGCGKVFKATDMHALVNMPKGAVLVIKNSSPRFIGGLAKACAVVVEKGNCTDHMASVIREFKVPCIVRVASIFSMLSDGQRITVDASRGIIYKGSVPGLPSEATTLKKSVVDIKMTESHRLLNRVADFVFPLNLTDPRDPDFRPEACQTWHDIVRFCHETALNEMFLLKEKNHLGALKNVFAVDTTLPFKLYVLDILGDTISRPAKRDILPEHVASLPFQALWKGMTASDVRWTGPDQQLGVQDLFSAMFRTPSFATPLVDTNSYAVVTREYLNLSLNMGYHYVILDCYLSSAAYNNHISLSFKGGAAEARKRNLRIAFVAKILKRLEFNVTTTNDFLKARLKAQTAQEMAEKLNAIGRMLGITRLLDLALQDDRMVDACVAQFFASSDGEIGVRPPSNSYISDAKDRTGREARK